MIMQLRLRICFNISLFFVQRHVRDRAARMCTLSSRIVSLFVVVLLICFMMYSIFENIRKFHFTLALGSRRYNTYIYIYQLIGLDFLLCIFCHIKTKYSRFRFHWIHLVPYIYIYIYTLHLSHSYGFMCFFFVGLYHKRI